MSASGRVCEITNGRFVEAKHEKRWLAVRLLRSKPAGRFGSVAGAPERPVTGTPVFRSARPFREGVTGCFRCTAATQVRGSDDCNLAHC